MSDRPAWTRRQFLRRAPAAAALGAAATAAVACSANTPHASVAAPAPRRRAVAENSRPGDPHWGITHLGAADAILGYAGQASVLAGEPVTLHVSTTSTAFRVIAFRMGWYAGDQARRVWESGRVRGHRQRRPTVLHPTNTVQAGWEPSMTIRTDGWPDGCYLLRLDADSGAQRFVPVTVRSPSTAGKIVIRNTVATWQAYNAWGGYNLYHGPGGPADYGNRSLAVSLDRPYDLDGADSFLTHERKLIALAERIGVPLAFQTNIDIARDDRLLQGASAVISPGHDEYWTPAERAHVTAARNAGVNIAFLGANAMFRRTRLAATALGADRLIICYKTSYLNDPMYGRDNAQVTSDWREPPHPDPESSLTGTMYESNPVSADYVVASPRAWMFRGTGARLGTRFTGLVGIEYDRVNPGWPVERPIEIVSHSPLTCRGVHSYSDSAYYTHSGGAGVFSAGTMRWVRSLDGRFNGGIQRRSGAFTRRVTSNILRAFAEGPAAARYPAHDNLSAMHEWPGDPIAAQHDLWPPIRL